MKAIDETGNRYGRLLVISRSAKNCDNALWVCKCDCGKTKEIRGSNLRGGNTNSCGCLRELLLEQPRPEALKHFKKGYLIYLEGMHIKKWCKKYGVNVSTARKNFKKGFTPKTIRRKYSNIDVG